MFLVLFIIIISIYLISQDPWNAVFLVIFFVGGMLQNMGGDSISFSNWFHRKKNVEDIQPTTQLVDEYSQYESHTDHVRTISDVQKDKYGNPQFDIRTDAELITQYLNDVVPIFGQQKANKLLDQYVKKSEKNLNRTLYSEPDMDDFETNFEGYKKAFEGWKNKKTKAEEEHQLWLDFKQEYLTQYDQESLANVDDDDEEIIITL